MTSPGVQNTLASQPGHERQVSKDTQATLAHDDGANTGANVDRRTRKRAVSDDGDDDQGAHEAKRFRVTAETSAAPPAATTTAQMTGLPTAAAPQNLSMNTTAAPAVVDNHHHADTDEPDEVLSENEDDDAAPTQGGGHPTTSAYDDDEDPVLPTCVWTTLEPAALAYGIRPNYVDANRTPWRLTIIPPAPGRGPPNNVQVTSAGLPTCVWVRLGPKHFRYKPKPEWADEDGCAWRLILFPPPYTATSEDEDAASDDDASSGSEVPFVAQEEECDCCCCRGCCCCCRGCWCCELATSDGELTTSDDELTTSDDAPSGPERYTWTRLGPAFLGFDRYADVVDRDGVAWRRDLLPLPCADVSSSDNVEEDQASSSDDGAREAVQPSDADIEDDDVFEDAGAIEETDEEDDGSDGGVEYDDEDELEYAD